MPDAPIVPVNFGSPGAHPPVLNPADPAWMSLVPRGPTVTDMVNAAQTAQKMRQQSIADQGRNAMAQLYADPNNVDANGMLKPDALNSLAARGFPQQMLEIMGTQAQIGQQRMQAQVQGEKYLGDEQARILGTFEPLVAEYDNNVKTLGPERARQIGQEHYTQLVDQERKSGSYSPQILQRINPSFDPERLRANIIGLKGVQEREKEKGQFDIATDPGKNVQYRIYKNDGGRTTDITGAGPYTPTGLAEPKGEATRFKGRDEKGNEVIYRYGPMGAVDDKGNAIDTSKLKGIVKVGTKDESGDQYGKVQQIAIPDPDNPGDTKIVPAQQDKKTGQWVTADANRESLPTPTRIVSTTGSGGRAEAQGLAMINAGNEAAASLKNLVELPVGATSGWFKGLTSQPAESLSASIGRSLAGFVNDRDARSLQISWQGIGRSMATLEAAGRATGLVGLQKQAEALQPQKGDSYTTVLRSYAEIRQIIERSAETMKAAPGVSSDQRKLLDKIVAEAKTTVPWTVHDVNMLETGGKDSVLEFAKKVHAGAAGTSESGASAAPQPDAGGIYTLKAGDDWKSLPPGSHFRMPDDPPDKMRIRP